MSNITLFSDFQKHFFKDFVPVRAAAFSPYIDAYRLLLSVLHLDLSVVRCFLSVLTLDFCTNRVFFF